LLSTSFYRIFTYPIAYLFAFVLVTTAVLQVKYVNRALQRFDSTQVIPTQFVLFTISVIVGSAILYRDFETVGVKRMVKFVFGCLLTFWGVWLISSGRKRRQGDYEDDDDEEEGYIGLNHGSVFNTESVDGGSHMSKGKKLFVDGITEMDGATSIDEGASEAAMLPGVPEEISPITTAGTPPGEMAPPHPTMRGISSNSIAITERSFIDDLMLEQGENGPSSRRPSKTPSHRRSISSLLPGPIVAGYQLKAVMADYVVNPAVGTLKGKRRTEEEENTGGRERSRSLSMVLDLLKGKKRNKHDEERN
jgi:magnesium transporter